MQQALKLRLGTKLEKILKIFFSCGTFGLSTRAIFVSSFWWLKGIDYCNFCTSERGDVEPLYSSLVLQTRELEKLSVSLSLVGPRRTRGCPNKLRTEARRTYRLLVRRPSAVHMPSHFYVFNTPTSACSRWAVCAVLRGGKHIGRNCLFLYIRRAIWRCIQSLLHIRFINC